LDNSLRAVNSIKVYIYSLDNVLIQEFLSMTQAAISNIII